MLHDALWLFITRLATGLFVVQLEVTVLIEVRLIKRVMPYGCSTLTPVKSQVLSVNEHLLGCQLALNAAQVPVPQFEESDAAAAGDAASAL